MTTLNQKTSTEDSVVNLFNEDINGVTNKNGMTVEVKGLTKTYSDKKVSLFPVSLNLEAGSFTAVIGPSGAGKSTFVRCINRFVEPTDGAVYLNGNNNRKIKKTILRRDVAMIFQQFNLVPRFNTLINVLIGRLGYMSGLRSLLPIFRRIEYKRALSALDRVDLLDKALTPCRSLSGGQQQRVAIARAIVQEAKLLLADEPVASLDPTNALKIMDLLKKLCDEDGVTVVANLHQLELAKTYADRIIGIKSGKVVFDGAPSELNDAQYKLIYN